MKCPNSNTQLQIAQFPSNRYRNQMVSSGRLAYQIKRYCENAM